MPVYFEPHKWGTLIVPNVRSTESKGLILDCCGIYYDENKKALVLNTAMKNNKGIENLIIPESLYSWGWHTLRMVDIGLIPFPCKIEFGVLPDGHAYAEILERND